jgi:hypothetical protein
MSEWGGACYDTTRKDLLVAGGGHTNYAGNEIYAFSVDSSSGNFLTWRRKITASTRTDGTAIEEYSDATPSSSHTYCGLLYLPVQDVMVRLPGVYTFGSTGTFTIRTYHFAASTETPTSTGAGKWTRKDDAPTISPGGAPGPRADAVYSASTGFVFAQHLNGLARYDPSAGTWTGVTTAEGPQGLTHTADALALTSPEKFVRVGDGHTYIRQITTPYSYVDSESGATTSGNTAIEGVGVLPGCLWDTNGSQIVCWAGTLTGGTDNRDYYTLNVATKVWTRHAGTGDTPDNPTSNGMYGRFFYVGDGLCGVVNTTTSNVYFLRVSASTVPPGDPVGSIRPRTTVSIVP